MNFSRKWFQDLNFEILAQLTQFYTHMSQNFYGAVKDIQLGFDFHPYSGFVWDLGQFEALFFAKKLIRTPIWTKFWHIFKVKIMVGWVFFSNTYTKEIPEDYLHLFPINKKRSANH